MHFIRNFVTAPDLPTFFISACRITIRSNLNPKTASATSASKPHPVNIAPLISGKLYLSIPGLPNPFMGLMCRTALEGFRHVSVLPNCELSRSKRKGQGFYLYCLWVDRRMLRHKEIIVRLISSKCIYSVQFFYSHIKLNVCALRFVAHWDSILLDI